MSCRLMSNGACTKSCAMTYNGTPQTIASSGGTLALLGTAITDTGCSISIGPSAFNINAGGIYRATYDVTFLASAVGTAVLSIMKNGDAIVGANSQVTTAADGIYTLHGEILFQTAVCRMIPAVITAQLSGVALTTSNIVATCLKVA